MRLSPPKEITFWVAVILAAIGVISTLTPIKGITPYAFWFVVAGFIVLMLGNMVKGL